MIVLFLHSRAQVDRSNHPPFPPSYKYRIYQDAQMILTKDITSGTSIAPIEGTKQGEGSKNLLDLSPGDVVFYVGGYPANFTVSRS